MYSYFKLNIIKNSSTQLEHFSEIFKNITISEYLDFQVWKSKCRET